MGWGLGEGRLEIPFSPREKGMGGGWGEGKCTVRKWGVIHFRKDRSGAAHILRRRHQIARPVIMKARGAAIRKLKAMR